MHFKFLLMALFINKATTLLSTPPERAQITLSLFILFFKSLMILFFSMPIIQFFLILQIY